jgi:hypothetical protein
MAHNLTPQPDSTARLAAAASGVRPADIFVIGGGNTYFQAWNAMLAGHQVRLPAWAPAMSWIFSHNVQEIIRVEGDYLEDWLRTGIIMTVTGSHQLSTHWEVLAKIDHERPIV